MTGKANYRKTERVGGGGYRCPCCGPGGRQLKRKFARAERAASKQGVAKQIEGYIDSSDNSSYYCDKGYLDYTASKLDVDYLWFLAGTDEPFLDRVDFVRLEEDFDFEGGLDDLDYLERLRTLGFDVGIYSKDNIDDSEDLDDLAYEDNGYLEKFHTLDFDVDIYKF
jgi:hypothetical protein